MSQVIQETIRGAIKVTGLPDRACFNSWREFVLSLGDYLAVDVPQGLSGVIFSRSQPGEDQRDKIWIRRESNGAITAAYLFSAGKWRQFFGYTTKDIVWRFGDSANPGDDVILIKTGDPVVPPEVVSSLLAQYVPNGAGGFSKFAVRISQT